MATGQPGQQSGWHLVKDIPLSVVLTIFLQTGLGVWWAATLTNKLDNLTVQVSEVRLEKYTANDAKRDFALKQNQIDELNRRILLLETKKR